MNVTPFPPSAAGSIVADSTRRPLISWSAVFAGLTAAIAMQVLFVLLGAGLGLAIYSPLTDENPVADLGAGALVVHGVSAVFSLWFGGWVAGRSASVYGRTAGWLHGFVVWCAATVAGIMLVSMGAGWVLGDMSKLVGGGLSLAGQPAAAVAGNATDAAKDAAKQSSDTLASFTDEALGGQRTGVTPQANVRAKREIGLATVRLFNHLQKNNVAANRAALIKTLADTAGMSEADANALVTSWTDSYNRLQADLAATKEAAEAKAREAAEKAADALALFSLGTFVAFTLGAFAASCGGRHGAQVAIRKAAQTEVILG